MACEIPMGCGFIGKRHISDSYRQVELIILSQFAKSVLAPDQHSQGNHSTLAAHAAQIIIIHV